MPGRARYLTPTATHRTLGMVCLGVGAQHGRVPACRDRMLTCYAGVFVSAGRGRLRDAATGDHPVTGPCLFWLRPGVTHSYAPDAGGWHERWVLFDGAATDAYTSLGYLPTGSPFTLVADAGAVSRAFARIEEACASGEPDVAAGAAVHDLLVTVRRHREGAEAPVLAALRRDAARAWPVAEHARRAGLSTAQLRDAVRAAAGCGPKDFLLGVRLTRAKELLATTDLTVAAIARRVGFPDAGYFARLFAQRVGVPPSAFRDQQAR